ncbi:hypothetical protein [Flavobacterium psychrophilum]|uniref:hypothetical protein n=1 Tax=Flavobacterium psychrophilum TaxID=96345 RepID=UPI00106BC3F9|nr:hypothetical protein [Flavobacterium psychrophilum]
MKKNKYLKLTISFIIITFSPLAYSQTTSPFEIFFNNKTNEISNKNIEDVYSFIMNIYSTLNPDQKEKSNYSIKKQIILQENIRKNEIDNILNEINKNLDLKSIIENEEKLLNVTSHFKASNIGEIDIDDYQLQLLQSNIQIDTSKSIGLKGKFDYSANKSINTIESQISYKIKPKEELISKIKLELLIKAFTHFEYVILSRENINKDFVLGANQFKLINLINNHIALEASNLDDTNFYAYKKEMVSKTTDKMSFPIYKSLYDYFKSNEDVNLENLKKNFPLEMF